MTLFHVGVALACIGVALFEVGVARATPKVYKSPPLLMVCQKVMFLLLYHFENAERPVQ